MLRPKPMRSHSPITSPCILVVDDEPDLRTLYELTLLREGHQVDTAGSVFEAGQALQSRRYELVISDMRLPDGTGIDLLHTLRERRDGERCIVITAYGSADNAVESLKAGAFDYLTKPVDLKQFRAAVASALAGVMDRNETTVGDTPALVRSVAPEHGSGAVSAVDRLVGESAPMLAVKERISKVARSMAPVLISGESGTGKELAARAIHASSHRGRGPWVAVNCSAIPEALLEAEFFGVRKGAYTGATQDREGFFQAAHGGTLFLDEIGDLPLTMQSKLLRAIQERKVRPLGSNREELVDVRLVSATHKDLRAEVAANAFRQDLFYRLNVIDIHLPALRERKEDVPLLSRAILERIGLETGATVPALTEELLAQLASHPLHGNVRELENLLHRAMALSDGKKLRWDGVSAPVAPDNEPNHPETAKPPVDIPSDLQGHLDAQEREILVRALRDSKFNRTAAAQRLGISLRQIRYRMQRLNIEAPGDDDVDDA